jgi:hypothetical protein
MTDTHTEEDPDVPSGEHPHERPGYPTALGASSPESITLLGHDLARDVMGQA